MIKKILVIHFSAGGELHDKFQALDFSIVQVDDDVKVPEEPKINVDKREKVSYFEFEIS